MKSYYKPNVYGIGCCGTTYSCNHPYYNRCTLYTIEEKGLAVIQQRFDPITKHTWWDEITDKGLIDEIYLHDNFRDYFNMHCSDGKSGLFNTVTVRQIMHALGISPLPKEIWETRF